MKRDGKRTPTQRLSGLVLADRADPDGGNCFPTYEQIAADMGVSRSTAAQAVKDLEDAGYLVRLTWTWEGKQRVRYDFRVPLGVEVVPSQRAGGDEPTTSRSLDSAPDPSGSPDGTRPAHRTEPVQHLPRSEGPPYVPPTAPRRAVAVRGRDEAARKVLAAVAEVVDRATGCRSDEILASRDVMRDCRTAARRGYDAEAVRRRYDQQPVRLGLRSAVGFACHLLRTLDQPLHETQQRWHQPRGGLGGAPAMAQDFGPVDDRGAPLGWTLWDSGTPGGRRHAPTARSGVW